MKHLDINWTKNMDYLHTDNYKTLLGEIKEDPINGEICCVHEFKGSVLVNC